MGVHRSSHETENHSQTCLCFKPLSESLTLHVSCEHLTSRPRGNACARRPVRRSFGIWLAVDCRVARCWCVRGTQTLAGTQWKGSGTSTSSDLLSSVMVGPIAYGVLFGHY